MVHTRRNGQPTGPDRSMLQLERDHVASSMDFTWPPVDAGRPNQDSRGIRTNGSTCYQVSVLQTLLHQPPFLRWILNHHTDQMPCAFADCISCYVKQLVEEYWDSEDPNTAVEYPDNDPHDIDVEACSSGLFDRDEQEDAGLFYEWLIGAMYDCGTRDVGASAGLSYGVHWKPQVDTLYRLNLQGHDTCRRCGHQSLGPLQDDWNLSLGVVAADTTIQQAITRSLNERVQKRCEQCNQNQRNGTDRRRRIVAAPKILCCTFKILLLTGKIYHTLTYPEILTRTNDQEVNTLPLNYRLMGVISHFGEGAETGHFIASVRGRQNGAFTCISDNETGQTNRAGFLNNPVQPPVGMSWAGNQFEAYMLMYERDDTHREMPVRSKNERNRLKELKTLLG